jgi:shikimate dehydrogenase
MSQANPTHSDWRALERVDGMSLAVLGDPIAHSLSPIMHEAAMRELEIDGRYLAMQVPAEDFEECIARLVAAGFSGANVTIPHKPLAFEISQAADIASSKLRAANTLRFTDRIECRNTDVEGFARCLPDRSGSALVLGAGAAASAAVLSLAERGWKVRIWSRSPERAVAIAESAGVEASTEPNPSGASLIVNATPIGLHGDKCPPLVWDDVESGTTFFDMAYRNGPTPLLLKARALAFETIDGREMLVEQGALSFEWWTGQPAPREIMRHAVGL